MFFLVTKHFFKSALYVYLKCTSHNRLLVLKFIFENRRYICLISVICSLIMFFLETLAQNNNNSGYFFNIFTKSIGLHLLKKETQMHNKR